MYTSWSEDTHKHTDKDVEAVISELMKACYMQTERKTGDRGREERERKRERGEREEEREEERERRERGREREEREERKRREILLRVIATERATKRQAKRQ